MSKRFLPHCTVALLIEHEGRILMVEEKDEYGKLVFGIPAGHTDARESIVEAALREGQEEVGCEIELVSLIGIYDYVKDYETILRFCFNARLKEIPETFRPKDPDGDILAVKWYTRDEIYAKKDQWRTRLVGLCLEDFYRGNSFPVSLITTTTARS